MKQERIDRINELARKAKTVGLTDEEIAERDVLRKEYIASVVGNLRDTLGSITVVDENGDKRKLTPTEEN